MIKSIIEHSLLTNEIGDNVWNFEIFVLTPVHGVYCVWIMYVPCPLLVLCRLSPEDGDSPISETLLNEKQNCE
jgi:hypothetical protein